MQYVSQYFAPEVRTPPLPLVAFVGQIECHKDLGAFLSTNFKPPLVSIGITDAADPLMPRLFGYRKPTVPYPNPTGILKADWVAKHRQRKAALAVAFVKAADVTTTNQNTWSLTLQRLQAIKAATAGPQAGFVIVLLMPPDSASFPADKIAALSAALGGLEARLLVPIPADLLAPPASLNAAKQQQRAAALTVFGRLLFDEAVAYYNRRTQRILSKQLPRAYAAGAIPQEILVRAHFKCAVMAEFRQDWPAAIAMYQQAYSALKRIPLGVPMSYQRHTEVTRVAELILLKVLMLHLGRHEDAAAFFKDYLGWLAKPPEPLPAAAAAAHASWLCRQYQVAAEVLGTRVEARVAAAAAAAAEGRQPPQPPLPMAFRTEFCAGQLLRCAASIAAEQRQFAAAAREHRQRNPLHVDISLVKKGSHVGQYVLKGSASAQGLGGSAVGKTLDMTDADFLLFLEACELSVDHKQHVIDCLQSAVASFHDLSMERLRLQLVGQLASQLITQQPVTARSLLLQALYSYRFEGWQRMVVPVLEELLSLSEQQQRWRDWAVLCLEWVYTQQAVATASGAALSSLSATINEACSRALSLLTTGGVPADTAAAAAAAALADSGSVGLSPRSSTTGMAALSGETVAAPTAATVAAGSSAPGSKRASMDATRASMDGAAASSSGRPSASGFADAQAAAAIAAAGNNQVSAPAAATTSAGSSGGQHAAAAPPPPTVPLVGRSVPMAYVVEHLDKRQLWRLASRDMAAAAGHCDLTAALNNALASREQQDYGWCRVLSLSVATGPTPPDPSVVDFHFALRNNLPLPLPLYSVHVTLADAQGSWIVVAEPGVAPPPPPPEQPLALSLSPQATVVNAAEAAETAALDEAIASSLAGLMKDPVAAAAAAAASGTITPVSSTATLTSAAGGGSGSLNQQQQQLAPHRWQHHHVKLAPRCAGRLAVSEITLYITPHASVTYSCHTFPPGQPILGGGLDASEGPNPFKGQPGLVPGKHEVWVQHLGPMPRLEASAPPAQLVGEPTCCSWTVHVGQDHPLAAAQLDFNLELSPPNGNGNGNGSAASGPELGGLYFWVELLSAAAAAGSGGGGAQRVYVGPGPLPSVQLPAVPAAGSITVLTWACSQRAGRMTLKAALRPQTLSAAAPAGGAGAAQPLPPQQQAPHHPAAPGTGGGVGGGGAVHGPGGGHQHHGAAAPTWVVYQQLTLDFKAPLAARSSLVPLPGAAVLSLPAAASQVEGLLSNGTSFVATGQHVLLHMALRCTSPLPLQLTCAELLVHPDVQLGPTAGGPAPAAANQLLTEPITLSANCVQTLVAELTPAHSVANYGFSLGQLRLTWSSLPPPSPTLPPAAAAAASNASSSATAPRTSAVSSGQATTAFALATHAASAVPPPPMPPPPMQPTTLIDLPSIVSPAGQAMVRINAPPQTAAGREFPMVCHLNNLTRQPQIITLALLPAAGFAVVKAPPLLEVTLAALAHVSLQWVLSATRDVAGGQLRLPVVRATSARQGAAAETWPLTIYVHPA